MANIAVLVDTDVEQMQWRQLQHALDAHGHRLELIAARHLLVRGRIDGQPSDHWQADLLLKDARVFDYDALVMIGGLMNAEFLRTNLEVQQFVRAFFRANKPTAVMCHAPWVLVSCGLVRGRTMTAHPAIKDDLTNAGAQVVNQAVCVDHDLISSRTLEDMPAFVAQIHEVIVGHDHLHHRPPNFQSLEQRAS
ncbi:MAG: DJ-1/PfpI family protein [Pseudomonadota bacterium]|nr:DJ-1/PfpI family protein [Pseudomonadota bacterium]